MLSEKWELIKDDISNLKSAEVDKVILYEDMFQAILNNYVIDCGWYNDEGQASGAFITFLIKDRDWANPIIEIKTYKLNDAIWSISICQEYYAKNIGYFSN